LSNYKTHAEREFRAAGWTDENGKFNDEMQEMICNHVLALLEVFDGEGHSGSSASYAIDLFSKLAKFQPVAPLTGEDWEWTDVSEQSGRTLWQNKRCGHVFKDENGAHDSRGIVFWEWAKVGDGEPFQLSYTSRDSSVPVTFPYVVPDEPQIVYRQPQDVEPQNEAGFL
jgi:hypothetical protein